MAQVKYFEEPPRRGPKRKKRKKRRRAGSTRWVMVLLLMALCLLSGYYFAQSPVFNIQKINVTGIKQVGQTRVVELSGLTTGVNIFAANTRWAKRFLLFDPMIKDATIKRKLPSTIEIIVEERIPVAVIQYHDFFLQVDANAAVLAKSGSLGTLVLPLLSGIEDIQGNLQAGDAINSAQLKAGLAMISQMSADALADIGEIHVKDTQKIKLYTTAGIEGRFGDSKNFAEKFNIFLQIIGEQEKNNKLENIQYIDVSLKEKPVIFYYN